MPTRNNEKTLPHYNRVGCRQSAVVALWVVATIFFLFSLNTPLLCVIYVAQYASSEYRAETKLLQMVVFMSYSNGPVLDTPTRSPRFSHY